MRPDSNVSDLPEIKKSVLPHTRLPDFEEQLHVMEFSSGDCLKWRNTSSYPDSQSQALQVRLLTGIEDLFIRHLQGPHHRTIHNRALAAFMPCHNEPQPFLQCSSLSRIRPATYHSIGLSYSIWT